MTGSVKESLPVAQSEVAAAVDDELSSDGDVLFEEDTSPDGDIVLEFGGKTHGSLTLLTVDENVVWYCTYCVGCIGPMYRAFLIDCLPEGCPAFASFCLPADAEEAVIEVSFTSSDDSKPQDSQPEQHAKGNTTGSSQWQAQIRPAPAHDQPSKPAQEAPRMLLCTLICCQHLTRSCRCGLTKLQLQKWSCAVTDAECMQCSDKGRSTLYSALRVCHACITKLLVPLTELLAALTRLLAALDIKLLAVYMVLAS